MKPQGEPEVVSIPERLVQERVSLPNQQISQNPGDVDEGYRDKEARRATDRQTAKTTGNPDVGDDAVLDKIASRPQSRTVAARHTRMVAESPPLRRSGYFPPLERPKQNSVDIRTDEDLKESGTELLSAENARLEKQVSRLTAELDSAKERLKQQEADLTAARTLANEEHGKTKAAFEKVLLSIPQSVDGKFDR